MPAGLAAERLVARDLRDHGYLVASRRHFGGAGDILAISDDGGSLLVEVKSTARGPFAGFPPADREAMRTAGNAYNVEPLLAWVPQGSKLFYVPGSEWPA